MKNNKPILEYNFLRLLCATIIKGSNSPIIKRNELQEKLYDYYDLEDYKLLFKDVVKVEKIDNKYIDLSSAFLSAYAYGLLVMIHDGSNDVKYIINMDDTNALKELDKFTEEEKLAALNLVNDLYAIKNDNSKVKVLTKNTDKKED